MNGRWLIHARDGDARVTRRYRGDTLILETTFETTAGAAVVTDFMPLRDKTSNLVRIVSCTRGRVEMETEIIFRFSYGAIVPWVSRTSEALRAIAGPDMVELHTNVPLRGEGLTTVGEFALERGQSASFVLTWGPSHLEPPKPVEPRQALEKTEAFWKDWTSRCTYDGEWRDPVIRSLLTLKALTFAPTGAIVAAPTTSLPTWIGGVRNWDYRYCWLRDATFTLLALMDAGYFEEATAWRDWLLRATAGSPDQAQIMYGLAGERHLLEWEIDWLPGFARSKPVRVGNAAHAQFQLDVYGEVLDALHQGRLGGIKDTEEAWSLQSALARHVEKVWQTPDQSLWEMRGPPQHFTHSKVMAWVAIDRAIKAVEKHKLDGPVDRWRALREKIHAEVCARGWDEKQGSFTQAFGSKLLDASLLLMPLVGFLPAEDPRVRGTVACIEERLLVDGFVLRYDSGLTEDGLPEGEGAFLACSFWLADAYIMQGRHDDARNLFDRLLRLSNDVGLLSEEYDPSERRFLGNFPQAFSHVAVVSTALNLDRKAQSPAEQRAQSSNSGRRTR